MEIFVQGTKDGWNVLYPKLTPNEFFQFARDIRRTDSDSNNENFYGKHFYSLALARGGCIFTKYIIILDVQRKWLGNIGFSIYISNNEKLEGINIKSLLDEFLETYCKNYCPDFKLGDVKEDWQLFTAIANKYENKLKKIISFNDDSFLPGKKEAAFIYYKNEEELLKYFSAPNQKNYGNYSQVFFVKEDLRERDYNPLNALRHSGDNLTGEIDLENPEHWLLYNQIAENGIKIEVKVNGSIRSNKSKVRKKDTLEIIWSKPYYKTHTKNGTWSEIGEEFIVIDENNQTVSIKSIELEPIEKTIVFKITDYNSEPVNDSEIQLDVHQPWIKIEGHQYKLTFSGGDLGKQWTFSVRKGVNFRLNNFPLDFQRDCPGSGGTVILKLDEYKTVIFEGESSEHSRSIYSGIKIRIPDKKINNSPPQVDFKNEEIQRTYKVTAIYQDKNSTLKGEATFSPKDGDTVRIQLKKDSTPKIKKYKIVEGKHGKKIQGCPDFIFDENDIKKYIKPNWGWKLVDIDLDEKTKTDQYDGIVTARYKRNRKPIFVSGSILSVLIISSVLLWLFYGVDKEQDSHLTKEKIDKYIDGIELHPDTLNKYKSRWMKKKPEVIHKAQLVWYNPLTWLKSENQTVDSTEYINWNRVTQNLDTAIFKRKLIDSLDFVALKNKDFSATQQKFKDAIKTIDSTKYDEIKNKLVNVTTWNLIQIADSINAIVNPPIENPDNTKSEADASNSQVQENTTEQQNQSSQNDKKSIENQSSSDTNTQNQRTTTPEKSIANQLRGGNISKEDLEKLKSETNDVNIKKSIDLYLKFWSLISVSKLKQNYDDLRIEVNQDSHLKNSELKKFLDRICDDDDEFEKFKAPGKSLYKTIDELRKNL